MQDSGATDEELVGWHDDMTCHDLCVWAEIGGGGDEGGPDMDNSGLLCELLMQVSAIRGKLKSASE